MKITEIELHEIHPPLRAWNREAHQLFAGHAEETSTIIVLRTDNGLEGLGEFSSSISEEIRQELEQLRGTNPCRWLGHPQLNIWVAPAIYDLVGKANQVPAYQLFGPRLRWSASRIPLDILQKTTQMLQSGGLMIYSPQ